MTKKEQLNKISNLQRKAISLINLNSSVDKIMTEEKILSLDEITKLELLKIRHRLSAGTLLVNLSKDLKQDHLSNSLIKVHNYDTHHKHDLYLPKARVKTYRESFLYKSIVEFNSLSQNLKEGSNLKTFVKRCKSELFNKQSH